jgi:16S rRNA (adenine1518-N6/adenine1519-N6)-dimethyltransferase
LDRSRSLAPRNALHPKKSLGQNFLSDAGIVRRIIDLSGFKGSDLVLEIGPGKGALTLPLSRSVGRIVAVEKDVRLVGLLEERLSRHGIANVTLINQDILEFDLGELKADHPSKFPVMGNLPYNISSPLLEDLIENRSLLSRAVLMFQMELARRLTAPPGGKACSALTLWLQYHARITPLLKVPRGAFFPRPKVDSMVLELDFERPFPRRARDEGHFKKVLKAAFAHRRKTILNSLAGSGAWDREELVEAMEACHVDPRVRAEVLDMDTFLCLASVLGIDSVAEKC